MAIMQHKRNTSIGTILKLAVGLTFIGVIVLLMTANVPAPQHNVEKELDAKAFLETKPQ